MHSGVPLEKGRRHLPSTDCAAELVASLKLSKRPFLASSRELKNEASFPELADAACAAVSELDAAVSCRIPEPAEGAESTAPEVVVAWLAIASAVSEADRVGRPGDSADDVASAMLEISFVEGALETTSDDSTALGLPLAGPEKFRGSGGLEVVRGSAEPVLVWLFASAAAIKSKAVNA